MHGDAPPRSRTYAYARPIAPPDGLSGLEMLRAMIDGRLPRPSMASTLDFTLVAADVGYARFEGTPGDFAMNPLGTIHGGYAATLLDSALGCAVQSTLMPGVGYTTVDLHVTLVRAMTDGVGPVVAEARVVHAGNKIVTAEAKLVRASDGKIVATGVTTCVVLDARG